ncbi:aminotransferase class V-fold PLP-dependent enzyme [Nostocoides sp. F2B08]|uniref:aminotransferase class V-fold PLP-dependent enzyme n=1 Tax=Nostocoides sp. F2B08 TaxID=2653936 RepID=UPI001263D265|nr:aminotransferase class V-fold PLP-dependent enzyme [Tetrasphaera sp. F2B08]KAB7741033.1 aminotransferase class V-fold PLP-dependent enzyme [Tetrasphaera sp. F2B08]
MSTIATDPRPLAAGPGLHVAGPSPVPTTLAAGLTCRLADGRVVEHANLDHGASAPALTTVKQAVDSATRSYASVHRGKGHASQVSSRYYEAARDEVGRFVGARSHDIVVFTRHTTDSMNLLASALPAGTIVFVFESEHHATLLPWAPETTVRLPIPHTVEEAGEILEAALAAHPAAHRLVALTAASNVTGEVWPLHRLTPIARLHGARVVIDAAQLAPHRPVDLRRLGADWVAFSGHKLYAPYGAGVLVGRRDWLDAADPYLRGGGASVAATRTHVAWHRGPARHEGGSPNVLGAVALAAACATFTRHRAAIEDHERALFEGLQDALAAIPGVRTHSLFGAEHDRVPVVTFTVEGLDADLVATILSVEHGIGVRDGRFCAHLLVDELLGRAGTAIGSGAQQRSAGAGSAVRVSLGLGNRPEHVERLVAAVRDLAERGPRRTWRRDVQGVWRTPGVPEAPIDLPW